MPLGPLFHLRDRDHPAPSPAPSDDALDYRAYSDDQLIHERDWRQRQLEELTVHAGDSPGTDERLVAVDGAIEQITGELIRRARSRHPSAHGGAG